MANATYGTVRRYLAKRFEISSSSPDGRRWGTGAQVRTCPTGGVLVGYATYHGSPADARAERAAKLAGIAAYLRQRYTVTDYPGDRLLVTGN